MQEKLRELLREARIASEKSYSPYSEFPVGAAVLTGCGKVYTGANVENASYGATMCAERVAVYKAVSDGEREILALAVYAPKAMPFPCGMCLQVLSEFAGDVPVLLADDKEEKFLTLRELLPYPFEKK